MTEDELIEKTARDLTRFELSAQRGPFFTNDLLDFLVEKCWHVRAPNARVALAAIREALQEPTDAMIDAGDAALFNAGDGDLSYLHDQAASYIGPVWKAMLSTSPLKGET
jgi:hypothetical protein